MWATQSLCFQNGCHLDTHVTSSQASSAFILTPTAHKADPMPSLDTSDVEKGQRRRVESVERPMHDGASSDFTGARTTSPSSMRPLSATTARTMERAESVTSAVLTTIRSRAPQPPFSHELTHEKTSADHLVDFDGPDDPYRPLNWPLKKKTWTTVLYGFTTMGATLGSSIYSAGTMEIAQSFGMGE